MPAWFIHTTSRGDVFTEPTREDARVAFIGAAFERQQALVRQYDNKKIVRLNNFSADRNTIIFTVDDVETERWTLRRTGGWLDGLLNLLGL